MKTVGSWFWKHEEPICRALSVERVLAHEMVHAAYRWPTPNKEIETIRLENEIMDDIQFDNYDRLESLYKWCD